LPTESSPRGELTPSKVQRLRIVVATFLAGNLVIAIGLAVQSVANYAFTIVGANWLGPQKYGALAALLGLLLVLSVFSLGIQATAARRVAISPDHARRVETELIRLGWVAGLVLALATAAFTPVLDPLLSLGSPFNVLLLAGTLLPTTVMGAQAGVLQGERRWLPLAGVYVLAGVGRLLLGVLGLMWRPDAIGAMAGVAVGAWAPVLIGWLALRRSDADAESDGPPYKTLLVESMINCQTLLAFLALSNIDVIMAKARFDGHSAGLYAGGLILTKAVLFLPQFVVVVAFPSLSDTGARRTYVKGLGLDAFLGLGVIAGVLVLPGLAVDFVGGSAYAAISGRLWAYALLGAILTMASLMVYGAVARQHRGAIVLVWAGLAAIVGGALVVDGVNQLLWLVLAVDTALLLALLWLLLPRTQSGEAPSPAPS